MKAVVHELIWFLSGSTNIKYLVDNDVHIWDEWAYKRFENARKESNRHFTFEADEVLKVILTQKDFIDRIKNDTSFATKWGELGEGTYGGMWRKFPHFDHIEQGQGTMQRYNPVDQIQKLIDKLKTNPDDRRLIVSAWHPYLVDHCALPPCHCLFQFHTEELSAKERFDFAMKQNPERNPYEIRPAIWDDEYVNKACNKIGIPSRRLNCQLYQRSCDLFLGVPFNISSYSLLTEMIAHCVGMQAGTFIHTYGDLHLYTNHLDQVKEQQRRDSYPLPKLWLNSDVKDLFKFKYEDIKLIDYKSHPAIKGEVAV